MLLLALKRGTWIIISTYSQLDDYTIYYNQGDVNKADGVVIYVKSKLSHTIIKENLGQCKILLIMLRIKNSMALKITGVYRCHEINVENVNTEMKEYLIQNNNTKHHCIVGDFNVNLLKSDVLFVEFIMVKLKPQSISC